MLGFLSYIFCRVDKFVLQSTSKDKETETKQNSDMATLMGRVILSAQEIYGTYNAYYLTVTLL